MGITRLPSGERPRERLIRQGGNALSDAELLATLIGTGVRGASAMELAQALLADFGDLSALGRAEVSELALRRGLGTARACALAAALELGRRAQAPRAERVVVRASADVYAFYGPKLGHLRHEAFHVMCLDAKHRLLRDARVVEGGLTTCSVLPREAFAPALREGATAVVFVHNHPSGDPTPSPDDLSLTARLKQAGLVLGIKALDHVVVGDGCYRSMVDDGRFAAL